jgi:hypothetical protein
MSAHWNGVALVGVSIVGNMCGPPKSRTHNEERVIRAMLVILNFY